jgi:polysaccharide chain length determinant protein (PEP-CTERM system associated)
MKDLSGLDVKDYLLILWNRRWYFLIVFALISIGGTVNARIKPDIYRSEAKITVDVPLSSLSRSSSFSIQERINLVREHLQSRTFLERMIQQTGLYGWGQSDGFVMERAINNIRNNMRTERVSDRIFRISYRAGEPLLAQNVTRQLTEEVIRVSRRQTVDRANVVDKFVEEKFAEAEKQLREKSEEIRFFKLRNAGKLPEQAIANANNLTAYRSRLSDLENFIIRAKSEKDQLDYRYNADRDTRQQLREANVANSSNIVASKDASPEERDYIQKRDILARYTEKLNQDLMKYTENHPDILALKREISRLEQEAEEAWAKIPFAVVTTEDGETKPVTTRSDIAEERLYNDHINRIGLIDAEIAKREKERENILNSISEIEAQIKLAPTIVQELDDLTREESLLAKQYESLANQKLNAGFARDVENETDVYQVTDAASYPTYPEWPDRRQLILMSLAGGLILGIAAALGRELLDSTISSEEEAKRVFNLPVLAAIPSAPKKNKKTEFKKTA